MRKILSLLALSFLTTSALAASCCEKECPIPIVENVNIFRTDSEGKVHLMQGVNGGCRPVAVASLPSVFPFFVVEQESNRVFVYHRGKRGKAKRVQKIGTEKCPVDISVSPNCKLAAVANNKSNSVTIYRIKEGYLKRVQTICNVPCPTSVQFFPSSRAIAVTSCEEEAIFTYEKNAWKQPFQFCQKIETNACPTDVQFTEEGSDKRTAVVCTETSLQTYVVKDDIFNPEVITVVPMLNPKASVFNQELVVTVSDINVMTTTLEYSSIDLGNINLNDSTVLPGVSNAGPVIQVGGCAAFTNLQTQVTTTETPELGSAATGSITTLNYSCTDNTFDTMDTSKSTNTCAADPRPGSVAILLDLSSPCGQ